MPSPDFAPEPSGGAQAAPSASPAQRSGIWWTKRAVGLHVTLLLVVPTFFALFWWQVQRVRQGNTLSWAYVFEWPFFIGYAVYLWWRLVHDQLEDSRPRSTGKVVEIGAAANAHGSNAHDVRAHDVKTDELDPQDEELAAYNRYLAELHASGRRKKW